MAASFSNTQSQEDTESPSAQLLGDGSPPLGSESAAGDTSTMDPNMSPSKRKGGRQPTDNSDETKERHAELYRYYKANPGMSQAKMAEWYTTKFSSTMSQCTVSQVLKKQKLLHGEEIAEPRPRKRTRKPDETPGENKSKKQRGSADETPIGTQTIVYTPTSQFSGPPTFQAVNVPHHSQAYPSFQSPATPVSLANAALSHTEAPTPTSAVPFRSTDPSRTNQQPFSSGPGSRTVAPIIPHPGVSTPVKPLLNGMPTTPTGGAMIDQNQGRPESVHTLQAELESSRRTVSDYQKIVQKQETLIDNILSTQQTEKKRIEALENENRMFREGADNMQIAELLNKIEKLTRDLENEKERNKSMVELWEKEEQQLKELLATRSSRFPLGADMK
ncbi:hypothetical protein ABW19_dt0200143 [Dactylella cylindrospora]|nr:hypothetical protein ABW19_dt0200143 [Dactylella cylindrospora]